MTKEAIQLVVDKFQGIMVAPYAWGRPDIGIIKVDKVEEIWGGYTMAPDVKYGNWPKDVVPFDEYDLPLQQWFQDLEQKVQIGQPLFMADIGCGNGGSSVEGYYSLLRECPDSTLILLDLQQAGVEQAKRLFQSKIPTTTAASIIADMSDRAIVERINSITDGRLLDAVTCIKALYFCTGEQLNKAVNNLAELLKLGGSLYLTLVSIYNPMGIGMNNKDALEKMSQLTDNGHLAEPLTIYQPQMGSIVSLFTPESIKKTFSGYGLHVVRQANICWNKNGFGEDYPEAYGVSLVKE